MTLITPVSPILSGDHLDLTTAGRATAYLVRRHTIGTYSPTDIALMVGCYVGCCAATGVDLLIAVAQMAHETGNLTSWWSQPPRHNPAGIGVTGARNGSVYRPYGSWELDSDGTWREGVAFPGWSQAVQAHVGRLLAYAGDAATRQRQQTAVLQALYWRRLPDSLLGAAPRLRDLSGRWATDPKYAEKIAKIANAIAGS